MTAEDRVPLAFRLARIMGDVGRVEKKGKITSQGSGPSYKFARDTDVLDAVTPKMAEAGIVLVPEHVELLSIEPTLSGKQLIANIKTAWHCTDGAESIRFETFGQGADSGDKALPKAQSNARKYAFFMLYHIVTGDDPDHWSSDEQPGSGERGRQSIGLARPATTPAPAQYRRAELANLLAELHLGEAVAAEYAKLFGVKAGERASDEQMDQIIDAVRSHATGEELVIESGGPSPEPETVPAVTPAETAGAIPPVPAVSPRKGRTTEEAIEDAKRKAAEKAEPEQEALAL